MIEKMVQRGTLMTIIVLIVCVLGILAALRIPVQMIPDLDVRSISIITVWPGATPQDVEKEILVEQEEYLRNLPNLSRIVASAEGSRAFIQLEFPLGTDMTDMMIRVNTAINQVPSYPENVDEPRIFASSFSNNAFMFFSVTPLDGNPRELDMDLMRGFVEDNVRPRMSRVLGVSEVSVFGGAERQVQILVDPDRLAQRELTLEDIRSAIRTRNTDRSGGQVEAGKRQYLLRTIGRFADVAELNDLILARRGDNVIRLSDVAFIQMDHAEKQSVSTFNGQRNIFMMVRRESGSNVIDIKKDMMEEIAAINRELLRPEGMKLELIADDVGYVEDSVSNVWTNLALGALFATLVMFLFLRSLRSTLAGVLGIPVCIIVAFLGLLLFGRTINVISLAGIAFAIGMTLDNSIVVLESIALERRKGRKGFDAAVEGVKQVWPAVFASTMTTVLVFLPVVFVEQEAGQLYSDIAIAISAAILASMLVAITVLPTAAARLQFRSHQTKGQVHGSIGTGIVNAVGWILQRSYRRVACILITVGVSLIVIVELTPPAEYLPEGEEPKVFARMSAPPGYNLATMEKIAADVQNYFLPHLDADPALFHRGEVPVPAMRYMNMRVTASGLRIIAEPKDPADIAALMSAITDHYRTYPGMRAFAARGSIITSNDGGTRSINLDISGPSLSEIYDVAQTAYRRAETVFDGARIQTNPRSLFLTQPMVEVRPQWDRLAELEMDADSMGFIVASLTDGSYVDEFFLNDEKMDIYLYSNLGQQATLDTLPELPIHTPSGVTVPLGTLARISETVDTNSIRRVNGRRTVSLNIIPPEDVPLETGVERVRSEVVEYLREQGAIPARVNISISGAADQLDATRASLASNYLVALVIIYLLLVAIFNHWGYPILIMTSIPLGIAGGVVGLWLLNAIGGNLHLVGAATVSQPFDMITMLGFLILMGTVVNNPILIVHRAVSNFKERGMNAIEAVNESVATRLRPIAMSTITTICGLAPLVLIPGAGTELYRGVGAIVMFGIIGAALVSLTMLPALTTFCLRQSNNNA